MPQLYQQPASRHNPLWGNSPRRGEHIISPTPNAQIFIRGCCSKNIALQTTLTRLIKQEHAGQRTWRGLHTGRFVQQHPPRIGSGIVGVGAAVGFGMHLRQTCIDILQSSEVLYSPAASLLQAPGNILSAGRVEPDPPVAATFISPRI